MTIKWVDELPLSGKRVFIRVDFNVPLDGEQKITDDNRIRAALPTIRYVLEQGGLPILASHLGRPKGQVVETLRMEPVGARLAELLGGDHVVMVTDEVVGDGVRKVVSDMRAGEVVLLENLRFEAGEKKNDEALGKELASLAEIYINDAFGTCHRAHASMVGLVPHLELIGGGFLIKKEVECLGRLLGKVERPYAALLGGAKVRDKISVLDNLVPRVNALIIGGAMSNTFIKARGGKLGASRVEDESLDAALRILGAAKNRGVDVLLPEDVLAADSLDAVEGQVVPADAVPDGLMALDIGPATVARYAEKLRETKTVFWNGPMGVFEKAPFALGTMAMARAMTENEAFTVVGGGDSASAVNKSGEADKIDHISTGGGASLEFVQGSTLPGLAALER